MSTENYDNTEHNPLALAKRTLGVGYDGTNYQALLLGTDGAVMPRDFLLEVSKGNVAGHTMEIIRGHNTDLDTATEEDIWEVGGVKVYLTTAETMEIVSTDANDAAAGTGLRTLLLKGVDNTGAAISETITLNGLTNVTSVNSYLRVNGMTGLTAGATGCNEGIVTATATTAATVQCQMDANHSIDQCSHFTIPLNKKGYLYKAELNAAKIAGGGTPEVEFKGSFRPGGNGAAWILGFDKKMDTAVTDEINVILPSPTPMPARTDLRLSATTDTNNTEVRTRMYVLVVDD